MISNSTLKVPTTAFIHNNAITKTTSWLWGFMLLTALLISGVSFGQTYCTPTATNDDQTGIRRVRFNTIDNTTNGNPAYSDFTTTQSTTVDASSTHTLRVNVDTEGNFTVHVFAWIDWNDDGDFNDVGEAYDLGDATNNNNIQPNGSPINITVTNNPGNYRMRVRARYNLDPTPCGNNNYSEAEDYTIIVTAPCPGTTTNFYDTGGAAGNYFNNELEKWTFYPDGGPVTATFSAFNVEDGFDYLYVYDGPDIDAPLIGAFTGTAIPGPFTSTHASQALTFVFESDNIQRRSGWIASICGIPAPVPSNDDCAGAIELTPDGSCIGTLGTSFNATQSSPAVTCNGFTGYANDDVWYSFEAISTEHTVTVTAGTMFDIVIQAYSGDCGTLSDLGCADNNDATVDPDEETINLTGLTIGDTYYVRVYSYYLESFTEGTFNICVTTDCKIWEGTISDNWFVDGNWSPNGVPNNTDCVIIPDTANSPEVIGLTPPFPPFAEASSITILSGAELEIRSGWNLIITDELNNQGTFTIRNNGSLIQYNDVVNTGDILMERQVSGITNLNYVYWSSAVDGFNVSQIAPSGNTNLMFEWIPTVPGNPGEYGQWSNYTGAMTEGKGYIVRGLQGTIGNTAVFNGVPRNGTVTVPISRGNNTGTGAGAGSTNYTAIDDNWNLLGNPYPSAISADAFLTQNAGLLTAETAPIEGTIYLWDSTGLPSGGSGADPFYGDYVYNYQGANYISYNITGPNPSGFGGSIAAGQGFFVLMSDSATSGSSVEFNNGMRGTGDLANNDFLRQNQSASTSIERHRIWLDIINSNNKATSLLIGYIEGATNGMDRLYDGVELNDTGLKFYSFADDIKLSISGKALPFDVTETIPLGFEVASNGTYTIAINNLDGLFETTNQAIYLEDLLTNTIHDLKANPYVFTTVSGTHNERFVLRYTNETLGIDNPDFNSGLNIISYKNEIKVTSTNNPINTIEVYDILGRTISNYKDVNVNEFKFNLSNMSNGTFIVKARLYNGQQKVKKVVN